MNSVVSINHDHQEAGRDYHLAEQCIVLETKGLLAKPPALGATVYVHANDIRLNSDFRKKLALKANELGWRIVLFTNNEARTEAVDDFTEKIVFAWSEIRRAFPQLPLIGQPIMIGTLGILCQGYQAVQKKPSFRISERMRNTPGKSEWWRAPLSSITKEELLRALNIEFGERIPMEVRALVDWMFDAIRLRSDLDQVVEAASGKLKSM